MTRSLALSLSLSQSMLAQESQYSTKQLGGAPLQWSFAELLSNNKRLQVFKYCVLNIYCVLNNNTFNYFEKSTCYDQLFLLLVILESSFC